MRRKTDEIEEAELMTTKEPEKAGKGGRKEHGEERYEGGTLCGSGGAVMRRYTLLFACQPVRRFGKQDGQLGKRAGEERNLV